MKLRSALALGAFSALALGACTPETPTSPTSTTTTTTVAACGTEGGSSAVDTASGATVTVSPVSNLCSEDQVIAISGEGFNPAANNGFGVYVAYGPKNADYATNAGSYGTVKWVWANASTSPGQAKMEADGSFSTTITVDSTYVNGDGATVDCNVSDCKIITFAAHGSPDRTQDSFTDLSFS